MTKINRRSSIRSSVKMAKNMGKENVPSMPGVSQKSKVKKSKARPMPDFGKLHEQWEKRFSMNKAQSKKPLTTVQEFGLSKKGMEKTVVDVKTLGNRSPVCSREDQENASRAMPRESFGALAREQIQHGIDFEADSSALQSILNETGVNLRDLSPVEQTTSVGALASGDLKQSSGQSAAPVRGSQLGPRVTGSGFKVPPLPVRFGATPCGVRVSSLRESLSHRGCEACHGKSADKPPVSVSRQRLGPKVVPQRNSIYVKLEYPQIQANKTPTKANEKRNDPLTPFNECRAERILSKTPTKPLKSPGRGLALTEAKAQRVPTRTPSKSPMVSRLKHSAKTTGKKLMTTWRDVLRADDMSGKKKDKLAVQLQFADEPTGTKSSPPGELNQNEADFRLQDLEELERKLEKGIADMEEEKRTDDKTDGSVVQSSLPRPVLGELPAGEILRRSNPAYRQEKQSNKPKVNTNILQAKTPTKTPTKKVHFESPCSLRNMSPSSRYDVIRNSPRRAKLTANGASSPKAPRSSALKSKEVRYSPMSKKYALGNENLENEVYNLMCDLDKENCSPAPSPLAKKSKSPDVSKFASNCKVKETAVRKSTVKVLKENDQEYVLLEESYDDMSLDKVNVTLNESVAAMAELRTEAESLLELSLADDSASDIAKQLQLIQQKQEELMRMQLALHKRLAEGKARKRKQRRQEKQAAGAGGNGPPGGAVVPDAVCGNVVDVSPITAPREVASRSQSVVDMSPIACTTFSKLEATAPFRTPEKGASPTLLYNANKRSPLFPPLESTASESIYQRNADTEKESTEGTSEKNPGKGGSLAAGLLQMAQELNATPHRSKHWKKQMLGDEPNSQEFELKQASVRRVELTSPGYAHSGVGGESFLMPNYYEASVSSLRSGSGSSHGVVMTPIGTPSLRIANVQTTPSNASPLMSATPQTVISNRFCGSPQRLLSGSAQIVPLDGPSVSPFKPKTGPINTPLAMREKITRSLNTSIISPSLGGDRSIYESKSPEELSMAFAESPGNFGGSAFKSPRRFSGHSFGSPSGLGGPMHSNGVPFTSPVQFTLNRDNTGCLARPVPLANSQRGNSTSIGGITVMAPSSQYGGVEKFGRTVLSSETVNSSPLALGSKASGPRILFENKSPKAVRTGRKSSSPGRKLKNNSPNKDIGELSLRGNVKSFSPLRRGGWSVLQSQLLESNRAKYLDALADQEVQSITANMQLLSDLADTERCRDPITDVLQHGDEYHFVPIPESECRKQSEAMTPRRKMLGSAFSQLRV